MEQLMASHIMENKRIPRKIKKALKYTFLYPRVCGGCLRYGAVYTVGRNSKWTRKAAKIRRQMDYAEMMNMMTEQLIGIYANSPGKSYENLDSSFFGNKKQIKSFAEQLAEVKNIFKTSYDQAMALNAAIAEDIKVKQNEIVSIQTQIEFNQQVAEDNSKYISKLKDLIS